MMFKSLALILSCALLLTACELPNTCQCPMDGGDSTGTPTTPSSESAELLSMTALTLENGSLNGDEIRLSFSMPMATSTPDSQSPSSAIYADNYIVRVNGGAEMSWGSDAEGLALIDPSDPERKRVILRLIKAQTDSVFVPGDEISVTVLPRLTDAQAQPIDANANRKTVNAS